MSQFENDKAEIIALADDSNCNTALFQALLLCEDYADLMTTGRQASGPGSDHIRKLIDAKTASYAQKEAENRQQSLKFTYCEIKDENQRLYQSVSNLSLGMELLKSASIARKFATLIYWQTPSLANTLAYTMSDGTVIVKDDP